MSKKGNREITKSMRNVHGIAGYIDVKRSIRLYVIKKVVSTPNVRGYILQNKTTEKKEKKKTEEKQ